MNSDFFKSSSKSILLAAKTTDAPASARATAHPTPIPEEEPIISALLSSKRKEGIVGNFNLYPLILYFVKFI